LFCAQHFEAGLCDNLVVGQGYASGNEGTNILIEHKHLAKLWAKTGKVMIILTGD